MVHVIESQITYVLGALSAVRGRGIAVEPTAEAQARWNQGVQRRLAGTVWQTGGCASWYLDDKGNNVTLWPSFTFTLRRLLGSFDSDNYTVTAIGSGEPSNREKTLA